MAGANRAVSRQIAEAVYITAMFAFFNRVADAFGISPQGYLEMNAMTGERQMMKMKMKERTKRRLLIACAVLFCLWLPFLGYINWAMHQSPETFGHVMARMPMPAYFLFPFETMWTRARKGTLKVGDSAPDFQVKTLDAKAPVQLASLWVNKPVVLVFGSYT
jgi:hypothetical protein